MLSPILTSSFRYFPFSTFEEKPLHKALSALSELKPAEIDDFYEKNKDRFSERQKATIFNLYSSGVKKKSNRSIFGLALCFKHAIHEPKNDRKVIELAERLRLYLPYSFLMTPYKAAWKATLATLSPEDCHKKALEIATTPGVSLPSFFTFYNFYESMKKEITTFEKRQIFSLYQKGAESGCEESLGGLAICYLHGIGVQKNFALYLKNITLSIEKGNVNAKWIYLNYPPKNTPKKYSSTALLKELVSQNYPPALFQYGVLLEKRNQKEEALGYYKEAVKKGIKEAIDPLINLFKEIQRESIEEELRILEENKKTLVL